MHFYCSCVQHNYENFTILKDYHSKKRVGYRKQTNSTEGTESATSVTFKNLKITSVMYIKNVSLGVHLTWAQIQALPLWASHSTSPTLFFQVQTRLSDNIFLSGLLFVHLLYDYNHLKKIFFKLGYSCFTMLC